MTAAIAWAAQTFSAVKGVLHAPEPSPSLNSELRDGLLTAIAKARGWVDDLLGDRVASFAEIAAREGKTDTSACWPRSPSPHRGSLRYSSMALSGQISPLPGWQERYRIRGPSRNASSDCRVRER